VASIAKLLNMTDIQQGDKMKNQTANRSAFIALFAALISIASFIAIPVGALGVPIVLQNMIVVLAGVVLGIEGAAAVALFMVLGALGFPVFSGGRSGIAPFFAPAGGYLIGYLFAAFFAGLIAGRPSLLNGKENFLKIFAASVLGFLIIYLAGTPRLAQIIMQTKNISFVESIKPAIVGGVLPYIIGDAIKLIILIPLALKLRPVVARYLCKE
jgi:biotin transport system substrate-specific component